MTSGRVTLLALAVLALASPAAAGPEPAPQRPLRIRILAARDYRAETLHHRQELERLVAALNRRTSSPRVRFDLVEIRPWDRLSAQAPLGELVEDLEKREPGADVDWVVGIASALPLVPTSNIGRARMFGKHFVLRSAAFHQYSPALVFLHEWAHTLGAVHVTAPGSLMLPSYDVRAQTLDPVNALVVAAVLRARLDGTPAGVLLASLRALLRDRGPSWQEYLREVEPLLSRPAEVAAPLRDPARDRAIDELSPLRKPARKSAP